MRIIGVTGIVLLAALWLVARPDPREKYTQGCGVPNVSRSETWASASMARYRITELLENAEHIYGPYNRAEQRLIEFGHFLGAPMTQNQAYGARVSASIAELSLIWDLAKAFRSSPCNTQNLVPDHREDSRQKAVSKLRALSNVLN